MSASISPKLHKASLFSTTGLILGPSSALAIMLFGNLAPENPAVTNTLAIAAFMAIWWITEAVPLAVTSLLPVALFPIFGIMDGKAVASTYFNHIIFLFIGGFIIALAMQKWDLHKRIALRIMMLTGTSPSRILLGFMLATAFLSMWISNTATAMMMIPIVISIIGELEFRIGKSEIRKYSLGLLLGIAYSASIGGVATLVGTPPNLSFARIFQIYFPEAPEISFAQWFIFAIPLTIVLFLITWVYLQVLFRPDKKNWKYLSPTTFKEHYKTLGRKTYEEKVVLTAFISVAVLWLTRADIQAGPVLIPGWSGWLNQPEYINDGTVAIFIAILLFVFPAGKQSNGRIMDWETARQLPWSIVLLFGGGFALASGFKESELSLWFGNQLKWVGGMNPLIVIFCISIMVTFLTELTSNTATTEMLLPVLAGLAVSIEINPLFLMIPATLSASMAFMLPVATPPNAIIFGTGKIRIPEMARAGLVLNFIGAIIVTLAVYFIGYLVFDIDLNVFPEWARITG